MGYMTCCCKLVALCCKVCIGNGLEEVCDYGMDGTAGTSEMGDF